MRTTASELSTSSNSGSEFVIPQGLETWLVSFVIDALRETEVLRVNGALEHAQARDRVIGKFLEAAVAWLHAELTVAEVAKETGRCEETVRRSVRDGTIPDRRPHKKGRHSVRRGDAGALDSAKGKRYDAIADAQDIAKIRRGAG